MLVEIWMVKAILVRSQVEMRNMLSGNGKKMIFVTRVAKNLAELCFCSRVLWKTELVSNEIRYLAEEISKQTVEVMA